MTKLLGSIAVSLFVDNFVEFDKSEANTNNNMMMRRAGLSVNYRKGWQWNGIQQNYCLRFFEMFLYLFVYICIYLQTIPKNCIYLHIFVYICIHLYIFDKITVSVSLRCSCMRHLSGHLCWQPSLSGTYDDNIGVD